jgi:transposase
MQKRITIQFHETLDDLKASYHAEHDPITRTHKQAICLLARGRTTQDVADITGYTCPWVRALAHRYNAHGLAGLGDHRHTNPGASRLLSPAVETELATTLTAPHPDGGLWNGPKVAAWMAERLGRPVHPQRGWDYLCHLDYTPQVPRPQHAQADPEAQAAVKKTALH